MVQGGIWGFRTFLPRAFALVVAGAVLGAAGTGVAQTTSQTTGQTDLGSLSGIEQDSPVLLEADSLSYDSASQTVIAAGNATVYYGDYTVRADRITYDRSTDTVIAFGNVKITEPGGNVVLAESFTLRDQLREGFIRSVNVLLTENAHIQAASGQRTGGNVTEFDDAIYTACKRCEEHPDRPVAWQLRAVKVRHDQVAKTVEYEDVTFEVFGVPIAYFPYFKHPDPSVKKQSGFLVPQFISSDFLGFGARIPYFWNLAPNYDITFRPLVSSKQGVLFDAEWRHRLDQGYYTFRPTFIWQANPPSVAPGNERFRGAIQTKGRFDINEYWRWGWDATLTTDETFLRRYDLNSASTLTTTGFLTGLSERNYFSAKAYQFEGLLSTDDSDTTPLVLPVIDHNFIFDQPVLGGELAVNSTLFSISRNTGADSTRVSSDLMWQRTFVGPSGMLFKPFGSLRGDMYWTDNVADPTVAGGVRSSESFGRFLPSAGLEFRWPWARNDSLGTHVFEPIAQIIARPDEPDAAKVASEDSASLLFEASQLFDYDKFSGIDRWEGGTRANLGFRYTLAQDNGGSFSATFGQSYQLAGKNSFGAKSGLESDVSDFVGSVYYRPNENLQLSTRARFDESDFEAKVLEFSLAGKEGDFAGAVRYTNIDATANPDSTTDRQEIGLSASYQINDEWRVYGDGAFDIAASRQISDKIGIGYSNECFGLDLAFSESYFEDRDITPDRKLMLSFSLRTLGGTSFSSSVQ
ncbi:MAG: LPS-assembly protein LptD [Alphaproteobacteria bacterium]